MQPVAFSSPQTTQGDNPWFVSRRNFHIRKLYTLFFKTHTVFVDRALKFLKNDRNIARTDSFAKGDRNHSLGQLKDLCQNLFQADNGYEQHGQHLNWAIHALFHATVKLQENSKMYSFHNQGRNQGEGDAAHNAFMKTILQEMQEQFNTQQRLFDNAKDLLRLMLVDQTGNDLLLRLLIEEEEKGQALWHESTLKLFADMFPYQPEAGYVQAGKSYFMAGWLEDALKAYEKSLVLNTDLSEPRRQTYLIRAMIQDRDHLQQ